MWHSRGIGVAFLLLVGVGTVHAQEDRSRQGWIWWYGWPWMWKERVTSDTLLRDNQHHLFNAAVRTYGLTWEPVTNENVKENYDYVWYSQKRDRWQLDLPDRSMTLGGTKNEIWTSFRENNWWPPQVNTDVGIDLLGNNPMPWLKDYLKVNPSANFNLELFRYSYQFYPWGVPCIVRVAASITLRAFAEIQVALQENLPWKGGLGLAFGVAVSLAGGVGFDWGGVGGLIGLEAVLTPMEVEASWNREWYWSSGRGKNKYNLKLQARGEVNAIIDGYVRFWGWSQAFTKRWNLWKSQPWEFVSWTKEDGP